MTTLLAIALVPLAAWTLYLLFCAWIVWHTGDSRSLRDVATAARAFPLVPGRRSRDRTGGPSG